MAGREVAPGGEPVEGLGEGLPVEVPETDEERAERLAAEAAAQAERERIAAAEAHAKRLAAAVHGLQVCAEAAPDALNAWLESLGEAAIDGAIALGVRAERTRHGRKVAAGLAAMAGCPVEVFAEADLSDPASIAGTMLQLAPARAGA